MRAQVRSRQRARLFPRLVVLVALGAVTAEAQETRQLSGVVRALPDSQPLVGVRVRSIGDPVVRAETDATGRFVMSVPAREVLLVFERIGVLADTVSIPPGHTVVTVYLTALPISLSPVVWQPTPAPRQRFAETAQTSTMTLTPVDIEGAPSLAEPDVVRSVLLLPGTVAENDFSVGFSVRGGERDQNLIRMDGIPVFNASHIGGLFSFFDPAAIAQADLITGGFPARYGGRLSSVLDIRLRDGNTHSTVVQGNLSVLATKLLVEGPLPGDASYMIGARATYPEVATDVFSGESLPFRFVDGLGKVTVPLGTKGLITATGFWGKDFMEQPWVSAEPGRPGVDLNFTLENRLAGLNAVQALGMARLEQHLSVTEFATRLRFDPEIKRFESTIRLITASAMLVLTPRNHEVRFGVGAELHSLNYTIRSTVLKTVELDQSYRPRVWSTFVEDRWRPVEWLLLRPGVRIEYVTGTDFTGVAPRVGVKAFLLRDLALIGSAGRYYQAIHSMREDQVPVTDFDFWIGADPVTPVARADHLVFGFEQWIGADQSLTVEGFLKSFDNVARRNEADDRAVHGDEFFLTDGYARGFDLMLRRYRGAVKGWISYTFLKSLRHARDGRTFPPDQDRRHSVEVVLQAPGPLGSDLTVRWGYGSPLPYTGIIGEWFRREYNAVTHSFERFESEPLSTTVNGARFPSYSRLDLGLRWQFEHFGGIWRPYLLLLNAYNRQNVFQYTFDFASAPPTRSGTSQLPFLPTVGLEFEW